MWRRALALGVTVGLAATCGAALAASGIPPGPRASAPGHRRCGSTTLFQHRFAVEAQGIGCTKARAVVSAPCAVDLDRQWSCASYREEAPFVAWFPSEDLFKRTRYPAVLLRRYPCSQAKVTPALFALFTKGFPTRRQLLADDVLRCGLLQPGDSAAAVREVLGAPEGEETEAGRFYFVYGLGLERDSIIQIDPELLEIELKRDRVTAIAMVQG